MGRSLYFECASGISGDMTVAALLDLGADREKLLRVLDSVPADGFSVEISRVKKSGIDCMDFAVKLDAAHENHDHDMAYLHGQDHDGGQEHDHHHDGGHAHGHEHHHDDGHAHDQHHHAHRHLAEINDILDRTEMTDGARTLAKKIFAILADAEAKAHGLSVEKVHFHEVGAIDSIVDIIAIAVCFDDLKISDVIIKSVTEGTGTVRCQHGVLPVPVPAVANIAERYVLPLAIADVRGEFVTPTGAAFLAAVKTADRLPERFRILRTGLGAGKRTYALPSILRAMVIETAETGQDATDTAGLRNAVADGAKQSGGAVKDKPVDADMIYKLETDIDDSTGEELGLVTELLFAAGAREVHYTPVYMKKGRPAYALVVLCDEARIAEMECVIFHHTTTIGIRRCQMERTVLPRREIAVTLPDAPKTPIRVKVCELPWTGATAPTADGRDAIAPERAVRYYPEYDDVAAVVKATGRSYREIYAEAVKRAAI